MVAMWIYKFVFFKSKNIRIKKKKNCSCSVVISQQANTIYSVFFYFHMGQLAGIDQFLVWKNQLLRIRRPTDKRQHGILVEHEIIPISQKAN